MVGVELSAIGASARPGSPPIVSNTFWALTSAVLLVLAVADRPIVAPQPPSLVEFGSETEIVLSDDPSIVTIANNTFLVWQLSSTVTLYGTDGAVVNVSSNVPAELPAAGSAAVTIDPVPSGAEAATGFLIVTARTEDETVVLHRAVSTATAAPNATPGVTKWTGSNGGVMRGQRLPELPLSSGTCADVSGSDVLVASGSAIARLTFECVSVNGESVIEFDASQITEPGDYAGNLKIGTTDVELKFVETRSWVMAVGCLLFGFALATANQAYANNTRPLRRANRRLNDIGVAALAKQAEFQDRSDGQRYGSYEIVVGVLKEVGRLQSSIDQIRANGLPRLVSWLLPRNADEQKAELDTIIADMAALADDVDSWPDRATDLSELTTLLVELKVVDRRDPGRPLPTNPVTETAPGLFTTATKLIAPLGTVDGEVELDIDAIRKLASAVPTTTGAAELVVAFIELRAKMPTEPPNAEVVDQSDRDVYFQARRLRSLIAAELRDAPDASAIEKANVDTMVVEFRRLVLALPNQDRRVAPAAVGTDSVEGVAPTAAGLVSLLPRLVRSAVHVLSQDRGIELLWLLLALVAAVWSGLAALYVDKPWGSATDFIATIAWALAAATVLTPLLGALENLTSRPLRLQREPAKEAPDDAG